MNWENVIKCAPGEGVCVCVCADWQHRAFPERSLAQEAVQP